MVDVSRFIEALRLPTRTLAGIALATAVLLFGDKYLPPALQVGPIGGVYRVALVVVFIVSTCLVLVAVIDWSGRALAEVGGALSARWWGKRRLRNLNPGEKALLALYIDEQTRSKQLTITSGAVNLLVADGILSPGSQYGMGLGREYVINTWAWKYLNANKHLLESVRKD